MQVGNIIGKKFGRLTVISFSHNEQKYKCNGNKGGLKRYFECRCDCGTIGKYELSHLISGNTKSCGCLRNERIVSSTTTHGLSKERIYSIWKLIKARCNKPYASGYLSYGGRGITICDEWANKENGFINFYLWSIENGYNDNLTIERCNVDGNYEPSNCLWIPSFNQQKNTRKSIKVNINGESVCLKDACRVYNRKYITIYARMRRGISFDNAISY